MSGCPDGDYTGLYCETAIHSVSTSNDRRYYNGSQLKSGAGANSRNTFDTCSTAIYSYTTLTTVNNNKVKNTNIGVYCREATSGSYVINSAFNNTSAGIKFINILPLIKKITIKYDSILNPTCGIYLSNVTSHATNLLIKTTVSNNYITNVKNSSVYGIRLEKCNYIEAYCNKIARTAIPATAYRLLIRGIHIEQCENALIHDNTSERIGLSIKGAGSLLGTQFKCNTSNGSYNGFYFDAAYNSVQTAISKQGDSTHPWDNKWYYYSTYYGIDGPYNATPKKWFYRNSAPYIPTEPFSLVQYIQLTPAVNPVAVNCASCTYGYLMAGNSLENTNQAIDPESEEPDYNEMDAIMNESNNYNELDESFKYFEKQYAYDVLANTENLDEASGEFLEELKNGNIGKFEKVYGMIQNEQYDSAAMLNSSILPINQLEANRKWVNNVYFDYVVPQVEIPQNVITELENLASSSPFVNGDAVYTARAIVRYTEIEVPTKGMEIIPEADSVKAELIAIKVYPNPANDYITVEVVGNADKSIKFVITNTLGIKVFEKLLNNSNSVNKIDIHQLKQGFYIYEALFEITGESIFKGRIVLTR